MWTLSKLRASVKDDAPKPNQPKGSSLQERRAEEEKYAVFHEAEAWLEPDCRGVSAWVPRGTSQSQKRTAWGQTLRGDLIGEDWITICEPNLAMTCLGLCQHPQLDS